MSALRPLVRTYISPDSSSPMPTMYAPSFEPSVVAAGSDSTAHFAPRLPLSDDAFLSPQEERRRASLESLASSVAAAVVERAIAATLQPPPLHVLPFDSLQRTVQASECLLPDGQSEGRSLVPVAVQPHESLAAELTQFLHGLRQGRAEAVGVTVQAALPVLSFVWAIQDQLYGD